MKNLNVQIFVPVTLWNIEVEELTKEALMTAVVRDLHDIKSPNDWEPTWDDLKAAVRDGKVQTIKDHYAVIS
tara:strand:+ start:324 stop:539 length:216 start_codon:yes stop_codon:yes gene_type:complete